MRGEIANKLPAKILFDSMRFSHLIECASHLALLQCLPNVLVRLGHIFDWQLAR